MSSRKQGRTQEQAGAKAGVSARSARRIEGGRAHLEFVLCGHTARIISDRSMRWLVRMPRCSATALKLRVE